MNLQFKMKKFFFAARVLAMISEDMFFLSILTYYDVLFYQRFTLKYRYLNSNDTNWYTVRKFVIEL